MKKQLTNIPLMRFPTKHLVLKYRRRKRVDLRIHLMKKEIESELQMMRGRLKLKEKGHLVAKRRLVL